MKFELTEKQQKALNRTVEQNPVRRYLLNRDNLNFEIGDVLIKNNKGYQGVWKYETVSSGNQMAQRYVFIYKDEFGIGYVKQLRVSDGKLGDEIYCLADYDYESCRFEVDPEYAELIFLDADFDIKAVHRQSLEQRKLVVKANRKIGVKPKTLKECNEFFAKLKVGDKFWVSNDYTGKWSQQNEIVSITKMDAVKMDNTGDWEWDRWRRDEKQDPTKPKHIDDDHTYKIKTKEIGTGNRASYERDNYGHSYGKNNVFFTQEPGKEEKNK